MTNQVEPMDAPQPPAGLRSVVDRTPVDAPSANSVPPMGGLHGEFASPDAPMPSGTRKPAGKHFENMTVEA
jgi:hypothetical protein